MKIIPFKDCKIDTSILIDKEYPNAVFCQCGKTIHFKSSSYSTPKNFAKAISSISVTKRFPHSIL